MTQTTDMPTVLFDQARSDAFAERMLGVMNESSIALMLSIGHRTGLFDALADMPPATSAEIAANTGLNERYVREWLGAMVTGRIMEYEPGDQTYRLPDEHAALLTRDATPNNMASMMQWFAVLGGVEDRVVECFRKGGGLTYGCYHRFHEVMAEESAQTTVAGLSEHILPLEPGLSEKLDAGIDVLDIGCGAGRALCVLAMAFPNSRFTGYDLCEDAIELANRRAEEEGLTNVRFEVRDISAMNKPDRFDVITAFDVIHDQRDPAAVLGQVHTALRPGGTFLMQDIAASSYLHRNLDHPLGPLFYTISTMHCMSVSLAQGGAGLGTVWGEELALDMLGEAGFGIVRVERLPHDIQNNYYITKKAA